MNCHFTQRFHQLNSMKQETHQKCNEDIEGRKPVRLTDHISNFDSCHSQTLIISTEKVCYATTIPPHQYVNGDHKGITEI